MAALGYAVQSWGRSFSIFFRIVSRMGKHVWTAILNSTCRWQLTLALDLLH